MKRSAIILWAAVASAWGSDPGSARFLKQVEQRYNHAETLEVRFSETYTTPGRPSRTESGVLYLRKPGRMRWDYSSPAGKVFVSDGKNLYLYVPASNRVEKMKLKESEDMRAPMAFLLGKLNFEKDFEHVAIKEDGAAKVITAEPKAGNLPYARVEFTVASDFAIRKLEIVELDNSVLNFAFTEEKLNPPLNGSLFQFRTPAGAELVEGSD